MAATKTSLAWQEFRHSNLVSTSTPAQERDDNDYSDYPDGAEGDGFVDADSNATQMMVEIMDKYVQAGEALADKENDVRQLMKQVEGLKRQKIDLESRTSQLTEANEKLADSEGRWYSLAMELEDQMGVIKKGETYTLFQDKVDEAEARLEVATEANNINKQRLYEIHGLLSDASRPTSMGEGVVDEHHLQATILAQLRHLKSLLKDVEDARTDAQIDHEAEVEKVKNQAQAEKDARASIQKELEKLRDEAKRSDSAYKSQVGELQEILEGVKISCSEAEARAEAMDKARAEALETLDAVTANLELEREENRCLQETITRTRADLTLSQHAANEAMQLKQRAQEAAEANASQSAKRLAELETHLKEELDSRQRVSDLLEEYRDEVHSAKAHAAAQESQLTNSSIKVDELEDAIRVLRSKLEDVQHHAEENERLVADGQIAMEGLKIAQAEALAGQQFSEAQVDKLRLELKRTAEEVEEANAEVEEQRLKLMRANTEVTAARERTRELSEELERAHEAATMESQRQSARALSLEQEIDNVKKGFSTTELRHAAEMEDVCRELQVTRVEAEDARQRHNVEIEKMHKASTSAASSAQKAAVRVEEVLRELSRVSETARERTESVTLLRQELNDAQAAILAAQKEAKDSRDARLQAEGDFSVTLTKEVTQAKEEALRAQDTRLREMKHSLEKSVQQTQKLSQDMRNLEAQLDEAMSHKKEVEMEGKRLRTALEESEGKVADLGRSLTTTRAELDGKTEEVAKLIEESLTNAASSSIDEGVQTVDLDHHSSNGETASAVSGVSGVVANGHGGLANSSHGAELGQLQAQAEAMELELRCTIESFDGQLNAMAREKLAIQKQVKELTGQCTTLRKQVYHYKKQAKESEAHVEQIVELQQQLCATEATAGNLRDANSELKSKIGLLEADKVSSKMWQQSKNEASGLRARLEEAQKNCKAKEKELAVKTQDAEAVITRSSELKRQVEEVTSELSSAKASFAAMETELRTGRTRVSKLEELVGEMKVEKKHLKDFAEGRRFEAEEARSKLREVEESVRSLRQEKGTLVCTMQRADEEQAILVSQLQEIETLTFSGCKKGSTVMEEITALKERVTTTENFLHETVKALGGGNGNGKFNPEEDRTKWVMNGIRTLQSRLQISESNLRDSTEAQEKAGCVLKALKELSSILECDGDMVVHKVAELKKLTLDLFQQRDVNLKEIQSLNEQALRGNRDVVMTREDRINGVNTGDGNGQVEKKNGSGIQESSTMTDSTNPVDVDVAVAEATSGEVSKVLSDVQAMLGCKMEEVMVTLEKQQAFVKEHHHHHHHVTEKVLGEIMQSYLYNMDRLASFIAPEDYSRVCSLLAKASDVWSQGVFVNTTREGLDLIDEVTKMLTDIIPGALVESAAYQSALHRAGEEVERLKETMRKERLMMTVFRRWGHFYLAVSNEALRKRTKDRNHARNQSNSQSCEISSTDGLVQSKRQPVKLPQTILQAVLDQEYLKATRELASQPPTSLIVLSRARQEMDTMARKMQDTLGSLMSQPPPTFHDTEDEELPQSGQQHDAGPPQIGHHLVEELPQSGQQHDAGPPQSGQQHDAGPAPRDGSDVMSQQSIPVAKAGRQTTGPLVEDGISKEERTRFLREQREQRKANRKKMNKNTNRSNQTMTESEKTDPTDTRDAILLPPSAPTVTKQEKATSEEHDTIGASSSDELTQTVEKEPTPPENRQGTSVEESSSMVKIDPPSSSTDIITRPVVTAPPPRMFNPTNAAPPTGIPPRASITTVSQTQRHPTMAFSVNETVERALKEAKREASIADRRAMFWLRRFRDLAVLAASFTILSFSSDRSFDDC